MPKKIAIMQPYFFPYLGYWQLINAVDEFVLLDDVNFIMRGYINRNNILLNKDKYLFSIPLNKPSQNKLIKDTDLNFSKDLKDKFIKTIQMAYKKAPYYGKFFPVLESIIYFETLDLTSYIENSIRKTLTYLNIEKTIKRSSLIKKNNELKAQYRIIEINKKLHSNIYINAIGGQELYDKSEFLSNNIDLKFIKMNNIEYKQFNGEFIPNLSFIDVLMFNSPDEINKMLNLYELV